MRSREAVKIGRSIWTGLGLVLVGLGLIGIVVPGLPVTIFMILALFCFRRGSERFEKWLLEHKVFGPTLRDWDKYKGIRRKTKIVAVATLTFFIMISVGVILLNSMKPWVVAIVVGTGVLVSVYILTRPTIPVEVSLVEEAPIVAGEDQAFLG